MGDGASFPFGCLLVVAEAAGPVAAARMRCTCREWRDALGGEETWRRFYEREEARVWAPTLRAPDGTERGKAWSERFAERMRDLKRTEITRQELEAHPWHFAFREEAGPYWTARDPFHVNGNLDDALQVRFDRGGHVVVLTQPHPYEEDIGERGIKWRFVTKTNRRAPQDKGAFIRDWPVGPTLRVGRVRHPVTGRVGAWAISNAWVQYYQTPR